MKPVHWILLWLLFQDQTVMGQTVVYDKANHTTAVLNHHKELAEFIAMVKNQMEQIRLMKREIEKLSDYLDRFGDPKRITRIVGADELLSSLVSRDVIVSLRDIRRTVDGKDVFLQSGEGVYEIIGDRFRTSSGKEVARNPQPHRPSDALTKAAYGYETTLDATRERRRTMKKEMGKTLSRLQKATTHTESQKLLGILIGQSAQLEAIDREAEFAFNQAMIQQLHNASAKERKDLARVEEQASEMAEAQKNLFRFMTPPQRRSPTP